MPNASLHITLGIWPSRTGKSCTKWYWCSWQNKLQWLLNHMNYLSLWLVSHRLQTNVLLWLPLRYPDKNHLDCLKGQWHRAVGASSTSRGPSGSPLARGVCPGCVSLLQRCVSSGRCHAELLWSSSPVCKWLHLHTATASRSLSREKDLGLRRNWTYSGRVICSWSAVNLFCQQHKLSQLTCACSSLGHACRNWSVSRAVRKRPPAVGQGPFHTDLGLLSKKHQ